MNFVELYEKLCMELQPSEQLRLEKELDMYMTKNLPNVEFIESDKQHDSVTLTFDFESNYLERIKEDFIAKSEFASRFYLIYQPNLDSRNE